MLEALELIFSNRQDSMLRLPSELRIAAAELLEALFLKLELIILRLFELCDMNPPLVFPPLTKFKLIKSKSALTVKTLFPSPSKVTILVPLFLMVNALLMVLLLITSV